VYVVLVVAYADNPTSNAPALATREEKISFILFMFL
jgi:hypothetical protein